MEERGDHRWCRVYWGTHGCALPRGHDGEHRCDCYGEGNAVGTAPYYGDGTNFYGEDAEALGLVHHA